MKDSNGEFEKNMLFMFDTGSDLVNYGPFNKYGMVRNIDKKF